MNDVDETVFAGSTVPNSGTQTVTANVTIPTNATESDLLRMRVINDQFNLSGPCDNLFTGEAEDYGIYISSKVSISSQPSNSNIFPGENANFSIVSTGEAIFQWQEDNGTGFANISNDVKFSGTSTNNLTITGVTPEMNSYNYRCVLSNGCDQTLNSNSANLNINIVGIIENSFQDKFIIYPNPTNGIFAIEFNSPQELIKLKIMDASGKLVSENIHKTTNLIKHELDRPKGIYLIEVSDMKRQRSLIRLVKR